MVKLKYFYNALITMVVVSFSGCDSNSGNASPKKESLENAKSASVSSPIPRESLEATDSVRHVAEMAQRIKTIRASAHPSEAVAVMFSLLHEWNPKGKTIDELKSKIGEPTKIQNERYEYTFWENAAGGSMGGGEFIFYIANGRIERYEVNPLQ